MNSALNPPFEMGVANLEALIKLTTLEGQVVLDPFCGSGSTLVAAKKLKRNYIGIEFSEEFCKTARERLEKEISDVKLNVERKNSVKKFVAES